MYIKPELITEEFDLEDVLTASSAEPTTGDTPGGDVTDPVGPEPSTDPTEPSTEPETIQTDPFETVII